MEKHNFNGGALSVLTLDLCEIVIDNMPGPKWVASRESRGQTFKKYLREYIASIPLQVVQETPVETRVSVLQKAFRTINISGSVKIGKNSGKASVIDVVELVSPEASSDYAETALSRVITKHSEECEGAPDRDHYDPLSQLSLADRIEYVKINGKGNTTPVSDAKTIFEIIWLLPSSAAKEFRRDSAKTIVRVLGGDVTICQ